MIKINYTLTEMLLLLSQEGTATDYVLNLWYYVCTAKLLRQELQCMHVYYGMSVTCGGVFRLLQNPVITE